ncbi:hypothetical protein [Roseomonas populi]|uniref:Protoheme IX farnesyltransferase n=1 Tax=Roseomonas populi TaxID=3121582 RepID=A0ABT1X5Y2_9PROT|nr:hypothetical protein [Roseomonas pecuniae]MCR0983510.1 hypothetical protein [Roseomonas pecuniae]
MALEPARMSEEEAAAFYRRRRGRNIGMLVVLVALVAIFYAITMAKLTSGG